MQSILVYANEDFGFASRLQAAMDLARCFEARLTLVHVTPFEAFILGDPFGGVYALPVVVAELRKAEEAHRERVEADLARQGVHWTWRHFDGPPAKVLAEQARLADVVVASLEPAEGAPTGAPLALVADLALHVRAPVLAVPPETRSFDCSGKAMVAWNGSPEAAHALRLSLPLLRKAPLVQVVTVEGDEVDFPASEACEYLARHGLRAELHNWPRGQRSVADALRDAAATLGAAYIVMGAYGHSRMREAVLGGATRAMLREAAVPLVLAH